MSFAKRMLLVNEDYINMMKNHGSINASESKDNDQRKDESVVLTLPKTLRGKAEALIKFMRTNGVDYDEKHQLIVNNEPVDGTNYTDLLNDLIRYRESLPPPYGFHTLATVLRRLNVSRELVTNIKRYNAIMEIPSKQDLAERSTHSRAKYVDDIQVNGEKPPPTTRHRKVTQEDSLIKPNRTAIISKPYAKPKKKWVTW